MKRTLTVIIACTLLFAMLPACGVQQAMEITPVPTSTLSPSPTPVQTPQPTPSPIPTPEPTPSPSPTPTPLPPVEIEFKDRIVEKVIRTKLNKPEGSVTDQDMLTVWDFKFDFNDIKTYGGRIKTIDDLHWCVNLRRVVLWDTKIKNISALSGTRDLVEFQCQDKLKDFTPLLGNKDLELISLTGATDSFFKELMANCKKLNTVYLFKSEISSESVQMLAENYNLTTLAMVKCGITDASPFAGFKNLQYLSLEFNKIKDISAFAANPNLSQYIDLSANKITDWSPIENMTLLKTLSVRDNPVTESPTLDQLENEGCIIYR